MRRCLPRGLCIFLLGCAPAVVSAPAENQRMALELTVAGESEILAAALHAYGRVRPSCHTPWTSLAVNLHRPERRSRERSRKYSNQEVPEGLAQ